MWKKYLVEQKYTQLFSPEFYVIFHSNFFLFFESKTEAKRQQLSWPIFANDCYQEINVFNRNVVGTYSHPTARESITWNKLFNSGV